MLVLGNYIVGFPRDGSLKKSVVRFIFVNDLQSKARFYPVRFFVNFREYVIYYAHGEMKFLPEKHPCVFLKYGFGDNKSKIFLVPMIKDSKRRTRHQDGRYQNISINYRLENVFHDLCRLRSS